MYTEEAAFSRSVSVQGKARPCAGRTAGKRYGNAESRLAGLQEQ